MSLMVCETCTARYAPDLESCPQCGSTDSVPNWVADAEPVVPDEPDVVLTNDGDGDQDPADGDDDDSESEPAGAPAGLPVVPPAPEDGAVVT